MAVLSKIGVCIISFEVKTKLQLIFDFNYLLPIQQDQYFYLSCIKMFFRNTQPWEVSLL